MTYHDATLHHFTPAEHLCYYKEVKNIGCCHVIILHTNTSVKELICNLKGSSSYEYLLGAKPLALNILSLSLLGKLVTSQLVNSVPVL
jgi:hypothetical protein